MSKNFGLIGAAGYVAPKHMKAIKETNNNLSVAMDPSDSVGILDSYFPETLFFTEIENLDRHIYRASKNDEKLDYISICSPNYLHDSHIRLGLRNDCDVICEKPLVINPDNIKYLSDLEAETNRRVNTVLQLRYHDKIIALKEFYKNKKLKSSIDLRYITSRGNWYLQSWKAQQSKSGGLAANIGIHFFDMLIWIFGDLKESLVTQMSNKTIAGELILERANVKWLLSTDEKMLPENIVKAGLRAYRSLVVDGKDIDFSIGFADLHTVTYNNILSGNGFGLKDAVPSLILCRDVMLGPGHIKY